MRLPSRILKRINTGQSEGTDGGVIRGTVAVAEVDTLVCDGDEASGAMVLICGLRVLNCDFGIPVTPRM